jgi:hypothetical protein
LRINYFKDSYLDRMKSSIKDNVRLYSSDQPWLDEYFQNQNWYLKSKIVTNDINLILPESRKYFDAENAIILYEELNLSISQAIDERLWSYLTHMTFWNYMKVRWNMNRESSSVDSIKTRYFFSGNGNSKFTRNGLARLWWAAHITKDPEREDPYELTKILFTTQDLHLNLLERSFSRSNKLTRNILSVFSRMDSSLYANKDFNRELMKYINSLGGVTVLDSLNESDIESIIRNKSNKLLVKN